MATLATLAALPMATSAQVQGQTQTLAAAPAPQAEPTAHDTPWSLQTQLTPTHLPGGERMGLWTQSWLLALDEHWRLGPSVAAAATGQRGGLFVLGAQATRRWSLDALGVSDRQWLETSLYAGGGGGAGAPVGGGLMLMPSVAWLRDWGGWQAGLSWSRVKFPSGRIGSSQLGLVLQWDGRLRWWEMGVAADPRHVGGGLCATDDAVAATCAPADGARAGLLGWQALQLDAAVLRQRSGARLGLVGARAERDGPGAWRWTLETAAATHGGADGYMEMLAGALWRWPWVGALPGAEADAGDPSVIGPMLSRVPTLGLRAALGLGGGGAVPTGGGLIGKAAVQARLPLAWLLPAEGAGWGGTQLQLEAGLVAGPGGRSGGSAGTVDHGIYRARYVQASLGWDLDGASRGGARAPHGWRASARWQRQTHAARKQGPATRLDTVGLKLAQDDTGPGYLTAQAHSAVAGGAGAYSLGLVGAGLATPTPTMASPWRLGVEGLVGAAGGGGVATRGGAVAAAQVWLQRASGPDSAWQLGLGRLRSLRRAAPGEPALDTPVLDLSWSVRFGQLGR
jgi:hypothetical protein